MVVVELIGGLGNQMFQYAFARCIATTQQQRLVINPRFLKNNLFTTIERHYELSIFPNLNEGTFIINDDELQRCNAYRERLPFKFYNRARKIAGLIPAFTYCTDNFSMSYNGNPPTVGKLVYLTGLWQNEHWFAKTADKVRQDFVFPPLLDGACLEIMNHIKRVSAISVHIRRGDYLTDPEAAKYASVCPIEYYERAFAYMAERVENPVFFVFSNDLAWAEQNLKCSHPLVFVGINSGDKSYRDMQLMSCCQHNIIANSSFSWWGAWLNNNVDKIVIAPSTWLPKIGVTADSIVPSTWVQV